MMGRGRGGDEDKRIMVNSTQRSTAQQQFVWSIRPKNVSTSRWMCQAVHDHEEEEYVSLEGNTKGVFHHSALQYCIWDMHDRTTIKTVRTSERTAQFYPLWPCGWILTLFYLICHWKLGILQFIQLYLTLEQTKINEFSLELVVGNGKVRYSIKNVCVLHHFMAQLGYQMGT